MSIVKSFSVGNGDTYYIKHRSDNFTIIDCNLTDERKNEIIDELEKQSADKNIIRFISTHPDEDHIHGLEYLDNKLEILNFYCVKNFVSKDDETNSFKRYCKLRDSEKAFYIYKECSRYWMNLSDNERGSAGINIHWPNLGNEYFEKALECAEKTGNPNNISPIISYSIGNFKFVWMGDLETEYMENIYQNVSLKNITVLFAPHHGRDSGKNPSEFLKKLNPKIIIIGEAPTENLNYYSGYNTITQNRAKDITFYIGTDFIDIYASNENYSVKFLKQRKNMKSGYIGSLKI
jgi:hypothetical protein